MSLSYNEDQREIVEIFEGRLLRQDGEKTSFIAQQSPGYRSYTIDYYRFAGQAGMTGIAASGHCAMHPGRYCSALKEPICETAWTIR
jgi:hypothetical protein